MLFRSFGDTIESILLCTTSIIPLWHRRSVSARRMISINPIRPVHALYYVAPIRFSSHGIQPLFSTHLVFRPCLLNQSKCPHRTHSCEVILGLLSLPFVPRSFWCLSIITLLSMARLRRKGGARQHKPVRTISLSKKSHLISSSPKSVLKASSLTLPYPRYSSGTGE